LVRVHDAPDLRHRLGAAGAHRLQAEFTWDRLGEQLAQTYEGCVERQASARERSPVYAGVVDG
jgi:hypothetical protein